MTSLSIRQLIRWRQRAFKSRDEALWKSLRNTINRTIIHTKLTFTKYKLSQMDTTNPRPWFTTIEQIAGMDKKKGSISIPVHEKNMQTNWQVELITRRGKNCRKWRPIKRQAQITITLCSWYSTLPRRYRMVKVQIFSQLTTAKHLIELTLLWP